MGIFGSKRKPFSQWQTVEEFNPVNHWQSPADAAPFAPQREAPQQQDDPGFWQGGDKFGVRDGIAGALAVIGDALAQRGGGQGGAVQMLAGGRMDAMEMAKKAAEQARLEQAYIGAGLNPQQARLAAMGGAKYGDLAPKPEGATAEMRNFQSFQSMDPEQRQQYGQYQDMVNPRFTNTPAGTQFIPRTQVPGALPPGYDPNEWEVMPGGGASNGTGNFPRR